MKKIKFTCSNCKSNLRVPTHLAGVSAPCPKCGSTITAPSEIDDAVEEEAPRKVSRPRNVQKQAAPITGTVSSDQQSVAVSERPAPPRRIPEQPQRPPVSQPAPSPARAETPRREMPKPVMEESAPVSAPPLQPIAPVQEEPPAMEMPPPIAAPGPEPEPEILIEETITPQIKEGPGGLPYIDEPAPIAVPETQSIKVNPRSDGLAPVRTITDSDAEPLPRLDVSLAGNETSGAAAALIHDGSQPREKTRVHLPQPGADPSLEGPHHFSPDDFITPVEAPPALEAPTPVVPPAPLEEPEFVVPQNYEQAAPALEETSEQGFALPEPEEMSLPSPQPIAEQAPVMEQPPVELPEHREDPQPDSAPDEAVRSGDPPAEGSFENLFTQPIEPVPAAPRSQSATPPPPWQQDQKLEPTEPREAPESGPVAVSNEVAPAPQAAAVLPKRRSDGDVLDEMFGSSEKKEAGPGRSKVIFLCLIGAVAIITTVLVIVAGQAMGGWKLSDPTAEEEPVVAPNTTEPTTPIVTEPGTPSIADAPAVVDPATAEPELRSTTTLPGDTESPVVIMDSSAPAKINTSDGSAVAASTLTETTATDRPAMSFDERVERIVNGSADPVTAAPANPVEEPAVKKPVVVENYNPPAAFPAPGPDDGPLGQTHDLIDAFLRAPDWETRLRYTYNGESLRPTIEEYYKQWENSRLDRFSLQLFQIEEDTSADGPYWVYLVSTSDTDQGFPLIVRVEDGNLKVDWEIYSEFYDQHYVRFQEGALASPQTFRVVIERKSDYYGSDRDGFANLGDYFVYEINPPYGDLNEFAEYAFLKKDSELAKRLDNDVGLGDDPLAVIITLDQTSFPHGVKHLVISDYVTEGWFR